MKLNEIIEQLESCGYTCEAGPLENNAAFQELKQIASYEAPDMETVAIDPNGRYLFMVDSAIPFGEAARLDRQIRELLIGRRQYVLTQTKLIALDLTP